MLKYLRLTCSHQICFIQRRNFFENFSFSSTETEKVRNVKEIKTVASIQNHASEFLNHLNKSQSRRVSLICLERLVEYMKIYPLAREQVFKDGGIAHILKLKESTRDKEIVKQTKLALALLGYVDPVKGRGVRILSIDGGGTRLVIIVIIVIIGFN